MRIRLNGRETRTGPLTVGEAVARLTARESGVAAALNGEVVPRSAWDRPLSHGDQVEVLTANQGG